MLHAPSADASWDDHLASMIDSGMISGYALLSHRGEPIAAHGTLELEFLPTATSAISPAAVDILELFDPRRGPEEQCAAFTLCGERHQVCSRRALTVLDICCGSADAI